MNSLLLVTIGEGTVRGLVVFRWFKLLEFEAQGKNIFDCCFSLAQKTTIVPVINSLHFSIVVGVVLVGLVGSGVKETSD